tara:strand:+ start:299 stop:688 length:390 start_codon:yes stop_codon:yes gene_type:complete
MNFQIKVYYEDTDATGRVYHSNYLNYLERARTEYFYKLGFNHKILFDKYDMYFVVKNINIEFKSPAFFEDILNIETSVLNHSKYKIIFKQLVYNNSNLLIDANVTIVGINSEGKLIKIPNQLYKSFDIV